MTLGNPDDIKKLHVAKEFSMNNSPGKAKSILDEPYKQYPTNEEFNCARGIVNIQQGKHQEAEVCFRNLLAQNSASITGLYFLAEISAAQKNTGSALAYYLKAIQQEGGN